MSAQHRRPAHPPVQPGRLARGRLLVSALAVGAVFVLPLAVQSATGDSAAEAASTAVVGGQVDAADVSPAVPPVGTSPSTGARTTPRPSAPVSAPATVAPGASSPVSAAGIQDTALPPGSGSGRRVVYSLSRQRDWIVGADGAVLATHLVSGQKQQPDPGTYRVYSKSRYARSAVSDETMEYMVRFARGEETGAAIGFHSIPIHPDGRLAQEVGDLGEPLSAGCVRQKLADAQEMWRFASVGTVVVVVP